MSDSVFLKNILIFFCLLLTPACALKSYIGLGDAAPVETQMPESEQAGVPDSSVTETAVPDIPASSDDTATVSSATAPQAENDSGQSIKDNTSPEEKSEASGSDEADTSADEKSAVPGSDEADKVPAEPEPQSQPHEKSDYKIGSGDVLEIVTWKEPDFTKELPVRIDGKVTFPLLNDIQAAGLTTLELKKEIEAGLKLYISDPIVTVSVKGAESQKFYILGEVSKTGEYPLLKNLTVLQAFALAGGFTEWASKKEIILVRYENGKETVMRINYKNIAKGKDFSQNILIKANDTIIVP